MSELKLAPPGAGLPKLESLLIRHLAFPFVRIRLNQKKSLELFRSSGESILELVSPLKLAEFTKPTLIKRLPGMEDSSRNWSAEQTLEHIQIVNAALLYIIGKLEAQQTVNVPVRTETVKPTGGLGLDRIRSFQNHVTELPERISEFTFSSPKTHPHPWFGDLQAIDWLRLIAFHQNLHLKQIRLILHSKS